MTAYSTTDLTRTAIQIPVMAKDAPALQYFVSKEIQAIPTEIFSRIPRHVSSWDTKQIDLSAVAKKITAKPADHAIPLTSDTLDPLSKKDYSCLSALALRYLNPANDEYRDQLLESFCQHVLSGYTNAEVEGALASWENHNIGLPKDQKSLTTTVAISLFVRDFFKEYGANLGTAPACKKLILELLTHSEIVIDMQDQQCSLAPAVLFVVEQVFRKEKNLTVKSLLLSSKTKLQELLVGSPLPTIETLDLSFQKEIDLLAYLKGIPRKFPKLKILSFTCFELNHALQSELDKLHWPNQATTIYVNTVKSPQRPVTWNCTPASCVIL